LVEINLVVLEKKSFKGKSCRTMGHPISSAGLQPGELMKCPLVGPFLGGFFFMHKLYKPCPKNAEFMTRRS